MGLDTLPSTGTYYTRHQSPRAQCHFRIGPVVILTASGRHLVGLRKSSTEPAGFALIAGDASVVSGFREIHVPRTWHVYSATGFDFREKNRAGLGSIGDATLRSVSYLATILCRKMKQTIFFETFFLRKTTNRHMVSFIGFYFHFLANFQS